LVYRARPATQEEYLEDVIKAAQFFGAMIYPEYNVEYVVEYITKRGFAGYWLFDLDIRTGRPNVMPGRYTSIDTWQEAFPFIKDHIEFRGHKECHDSFSMR